MKHAEVYLSLSISEYSIKALVAEYNDGEWYVLASKNRTYNAENDDVVTILNEVKTDINSQLGYEINNVVLLIPSTHVQKYNDKVKVDTDINNQVVSKKEVNQGIDDLVKRNDNKDNFVVNVEVDRYSAYGFGYVSNPIGLETRYIELEASIYTIPTKIAYPLVKLVESCGYNVVDVCLDILALAKNVASPAALKNGAIIVDMNAMSTNIAYFANGTLKSYSTIEIGGQRLSEDIALCANLAIDKAEKFKIKYVDLNISQTNEIVVYSYQDEVNNEKIDITQKFISEIALSRIEELIGLLNKEIALFKLHDDIIVYFCSGGNNITGLTQVLNKKFDYPAKIAKTNLIGARNSIYSKCLGALQYEAKINRIKGEIKLFVNQKEYINSINLVEKNNLLYNNNSSEKNFIKRLVSHIFNN